MGKTTMLSYWPSALLTLVLLIGICVSFNRLDCMEMDKVKALISILFGFATSCLLLSFIWLIQRKPFNRPWPNQAQFTGGMLPSMHPGGRLESIDDQSVGNSRTTISTISFELDDKPPDYHDALANSKPIGHLGQRGGQNGQTARKTSYTQLDVGQLIILSTSPPKYSQLYSSVTSSMNTKLSAISSKHM